MSENRTSKENSPHNNDISPKSSEEKSSDNYSVSTGNSRNSAGGSSQGGPTTFTSNLAAIPSSSSSSSSFSHQSSTIEPLVRMSAPLGVPLTPTNMIRSPSLREGEKEGKHSYQSPQGRLPIAKGGLSSMRRSSAALGISGKTVSMKGSFNSAFGDPLLPATNHGRTAGLDRIGSREHKRHGALRYDRFWDGVHAMIDIQNSSKLKHEVTKSDTKNHLNDFERLRYVVPFLDFLSLHINSLNYSLTLCYTFLHINDCERLS